MIDPIKDFGPDAMPLWRVKFAWFAEPLFQPLYIVDMPDEVNRQGDEQTGENLSADEAYD